METSSKENISKNSPSGLSGRLSAKTNLILLIIIALLLGQIPFLSKILNWQATFFHEISHGLAALLTGGRVIRIELHFSGSGLCYTSGGLRWLVSLAGYAGAAFWGLLIYLSSGVIPKNYTHTLAVFLAAVLIAWGTFYARDFQTGAIILIITTLYLSAVKFRDKLPLKLFLKLAGLYILLDALKAPAALLQRQAVSDAANLASQTGMPEFFFIAFWLATALAALAFIWKLEK